MKCADISSVWFLSQLTPAERMVAVHVAEGLSNKEIASVLGKSEATVKHQVSSILATSGTGSRTRFIAAYYQQFICPLPRKENASLLAFLVRLAGASRRSPELLVNQ